MQRKGSVMTKGWVVLLTLALVTVGCNQAEKTNEVGSAAIEGGDTTVHAPADVVPGSYEDWCGEHAVPESQCTRCNPSLVAAFKATGDWCAEHGLPESHCLRCNPDLKIERPPKPEGI